MTTTQDLLNELVDMQAKYDMLVADMQNAMQSILTPTQLQEIADIEEEFGDNIQIAVEEVETLREKVKAAVLEDEQSCKTDTLEALFINGRPKWDDEMLLSMKDSHPPIILARTPPKPHVTIRTRK